MSARVGAGESRRRIDGRALHIGTGAPQQSTDGVRVHRACAAVGDQGEVARVVSFLDRHKPDRRGELVACDGEDGGGRVLDI